MSSREKRMKRFRFDPSLTGRVGVEQERFIVRRDGILVPAAHQVLTHWQNAGTSHATHEFGYELSACQLEMRTRPCTLADLRGELTRLNQRALRLVHMFGYTLSAQEVGPEDMPLDVYPDPSGRYQRITRHMPRDILLAACRVIGTHVHVGMPNFLVALRVYNQVIQRLGELCELGNGSFGERLAIYRQMAPNYIPQPYEDIDEYFVIAEDQGFADDPRRCWTLIRISVHGTIEFRMFGATDSVDRVMRWAERCHDLCMEALVTF